MAAAREDLPERDIFIFDIDGTLTHLHGDIAPEPTGLPSYGFWDLLSSRLAGDPGKLKEEIKAWNKSMPEEKDPVMSSHEMMQKAIDTFKQVILPIDIEAYAYKITLDFVKHGVIRKEAIAFLEQAIQTGKICILSTGSYEDGARGFVRGLVKAGLLTKESQAKLIISGTQVKWDENRVTHANVREMKKIGILNKLRTHKILAAKDNEHELALRVGAVFGDDPKINDKGIFELAPKDKAYVIRTVKNAADELPKGYISTTWAEIVKNQHLLEAAEIAEHKSALPEFSLKLGPGILDPGIFRSKSPLNAGKIPQFYKATKSLYMEPRPHGAAPYPSPHIKHSLQSSDPNLVKRPKPSQDDLDLLSDQKKAKRLHLHLRRPTSGKASP